MLGANVSGDPCQGTALQPSLPVPLQPSLSLPHARARPPSLCPCSPPSLCPTHGHTHPGKWLSPPPLGRSRARSNLKGNALAIALWLFLMHPAPRLGSVNQVHGAAVDSPPGAGRPVTACLFPSLHIPMSVPSRPRAPNLCLLIWLPS